MTGCLLADIGGTHARFAVLSGSQVGPIYRQKVGMHHDPVQAIRHFLNRGESALAIEHAVIAAAGPVSGGRCKLTNADWTLDSDELKRAFGLSTVNIVNDLEAQAWALSRLASVDCVAVGGGHAVARRPMAIISPGTGLGMACFVPDGAGQALASEGGHATLAAIDAEATSVIALLQRRYGHVSAERVLSGGGLVNLYQAIAELEGAPTNIPSPEQVTQAGLDGSCQTARRALDLFCAFLGSVAGNLALTFGAQGGVYIGGGIVPRIVGCLPRSRFREAFENKGRLSPYMARIPTRVIVRAEPAFLGLAALASASCAAPAESSAP